MLLKRDTVEKQEEDPLFMIFGDEKHNHLDCNHKFWGRLSEMITGPDHEYKYLKKLLYKFNMFQNEVAKM